MKLYMLDLTETDQLEVIEYLLAYFFDCDNVQWVDIASIKIKHKIVQMSLVTSPATEPHFS